MLSVAASRPTGSPAPALPNPDTLYSRHALRQARTIVELRLLELRRERLARVSAAIARGLSIDDLLRNAPAGGPPRLCETNRSAGP